jgi:bifunctional ADP-heptose synthase (sugar kinase/adenylyltransferase)
MKLLVVGDSIVDRNVYTDAIGLSLESPTLKTKFRHESFEFGGAAAVAILASNFGADVTFASSMSESYRSIFETQNPKINLKLLANAQNIKSRFYVLKGDNEYKYLQINDVNRVNLNIELNFDLSIYDRIAVSDYRCGLLNHNIASDILQSGAESFAASQESDLGSNLSDYEKFDFIVCNKREQESLDRIHNVIITKGESGVCLNGLTHTPGIIEKQKIKTTIGAGDCFYASFLADSNLQLANNRSSKFILGEL